MALADGNAYGGGIYFFASGEIRTKDSNEEVNWWPEWPEQLQ